MPGERPPSIDPLPSTETHGKVLVMAGAADGLVGTAPAYLVARAHPTAKLVVFSESGHRPWVEEPERFVAVVNDFFDERA